MALNLLYCWLGAEKTGLVFRTQFRSLAAWKTVAAGCAKVIVLVRRNLACLRAGFRLTFFDFVFDYFCQSNFVIA